jgi:hypothetical protein
VEDDVCYRSLLVEERRTSPRAQPCKTTLGRLVATLPASSLAAIVQDLSARGIGLVATAPVALRSLLWVELAGTDPVGARVAHATPQPDGTWLLGCELIEPIDSEAFRTLTSRNAAPPPAAAGGL